MLTQANKSFGSNFEHLVNTSGFLIYLARKQLLLFSDGTSRTMSIRIIWKSASPIRIVADFD